ncbi:Asp-tRNA(Asn)/Glu-tRNA(Gln) amidotransferase subunit GatC [Jiulongibacter sp. NS-SX5]|uniref:Asp-tRNA(Asn)/Glu-tRNA(Gln) amidotransferase subunit GatC n=1 Tax=Jiulongibacter sp. NS-SX5 TaxID=3463854 RepID=UPI00405968AC
MSKTMTLEVLSSIKGAKSSKAVDQLFEAIKNANSKGVANMNPRNIAGVNNLRADQVINSSNLEKEIIRSNFPKQKNGYLVVSKVIEE